MQPGPPIGSQVRVYERPNHRARRLGLVVILVVILLLVIALSWWLWASFIHRSKGDGTPVAHD